MTMTIFPDSSVFIPYLVRRRYATRIESESRAGRIALCSVVATEVLAGARSREERRLYEGFFARFQRTGLVATPSEDEWFTCGRLLARYRDRYGDIRTRDHQNDVLIVLTARRLARGDDVILWTENDAHFATWLNMVGNKSGLRIESARR